MEIEPFNPRFPWYGRHLQTIRNPIGMAPRLAGGEGRVVTLPLAGGDTTRARLDAPEVNVASPTTVVLVHGLGGCETSRYMLAASAFFTRRGSPVYRVNLRGAGPSRATCRDWSHAGRYADLEAIFDSLDAATDRIVAIGFSLGGCLLLNYLARGRVDQRLVAAATVCAPLDLRAAAEVLHAPRNWLYQGYLLRALKADYLNEHATLSDGERALISGARTLYEVDDQFTAPHHGFGRADVYYRYASPLAHLPAVSRPTLLVHAIDDPFVPSHPYRTAAQGSVTVAMASGGGHLGFHDRQGLWHLRRIASFFAAVVGPPQGRGLPAAASACS